MHGATELAILKVAAMEYPDNLCVAPLTQVRLVHAPRDNLLCASPAAAHLTLALVWHLSRCRNPLSFVQSQNETLLTDGEI
jgi:hypothetical protein